MRHRRYARLLTGMICILLGRFSPALGADHASYCSGMYACLQEVADGCSADDLTQDATTATEEYCSPFKEMKKRGLHNTSPYGRQIYQQVSGKHRVEYVLEGTLPMSVGVMQHLMNNLPFSAQLINAYQDTHFTAAYLDAEKQRFSFSGDSVSGSFATVLQNAQQTRSLFHGSGTVGVLAWTLRGTALVTFDFEESSPQEITYNLRCMVFPNRAIVKSILNLRLFRRSVMNVFDRMAGYVQDSAMAFHRGERAPIERYPAFSTPDGRRQIETFQQLLLNTMHAEEPVKTRADDHTDNASSADTNQS
jgi:hypothetical protein